MSSTARATYGGGAGAWRGVIRDGDTVVWTCPHHHRNRDAGRDTAAIQCARLYLANPTGWEQREQSRLAWAESRRARGWH